MSNVYSRLGFVVALVMLGVLLWWAGFGPNSRTPAQQAVGGLTDSTTLHWTKTHRPTIETNSPTDAIAALGYVHGLNRGWTVLLWRQTALGRLGRWFGPGVTQLDRHARRLGLARHARTAYARLPDAEQARLRAYTRGMNAALQTQYVEELDEIVLLDISPNEWAPWHTLLIERLLAWAATPPLSVSDAAPEAVRQFKTTDHRFRRWLHLHGWTRSTAWAVHPDSTSSTLFQRHVLGASAMPIVQEVLWDHPASNSRTTWATLPGTLIFPTGTTREHAWASLLHSPTRLARIPLDSADVRYWHERLEPEQSDEQLLRVERLDDALLLTTTASSPPSVDSIRTDSLASDAPDADSSQTSPARTAWIVRWPGFSDATDLGAWLHRSGLHSAQASPQAFDLFAADGLHVPANGAPSVLGTPPVVATPHEDLTVVGHSPWTRYQAAGLADRIGHTDSVAVGHWSASDSSTWAAALIPSLRSALRPFRKKKEGPVQNAATYLRNWDYNYDPMSIGAVLFDTWMQTYQTQLGHVPSPTDTVALFNRPRAPHAFQRALDILTTQLGADPREWRWERMVTDRRHYPVWSADSMINKDLSDLRTTRYAPLDRTPTGHPSAPAGGPSLVDPSPVAPSPDTWEGWMQAGRPMTVRRHRFDPDAFFARWYLRTDRPRSHRLGSAPTPHRTLLVPKQ